jgi:ABC-type transport system involved in multi-copper enzyme maturation permease subunit
MRKVTADRFAPVVCAEWTKLRTVRGWLIGLGVAAVLGTLLSIASANGSHSGTCTGSSPAHVVCAVGHPAVPVGPGGQIVADTYELVHRSLDGNGAITARVTSLTGFISDENLNRASPNAPERQGLARWAKAGLIVTSSTKAGATYAAVMATAAHGVRFQYDYSHDIGGMPGAVSPGDPRWLRLVRHGDGLTAYDSGNGSAWHGIGSIDLAGLQNTVDVGLFVTSPVTYTLSSSGNTTQTTAHFDHVTVQGRTTTSAWQHTTVGGGNNFYPTLGSESARQIGSTFVITGSGDIAPGVLAGIIAQNPATGQSVIGILVGLIVLIVIAAMFVAAEYRRRLIRTTFTAVPKRDRVLYAKAIVIFTVAFLSEAVAAAISIPVERHLLISNGNYLFPVGALTTARDVFGSAIIVALAAVAVLGLATILRRSSAAVVAGIALFVLPNILGATVTGSVGEWIYRLTPAAGFSVLGSVPASTLVSYPHTIENGYYPLGAWVSLIVPCCYAAFALGAAAMLLRRRDP